MALYLEHFGLHEAPFRITPHTDFFFDGADRGATLEALMYAIVHDEGIVKVSGEVGSGKTMLCRVLMERLPAQVETVYLATPSLGRDEILHALADELDLRLSVERTSVALRELQEQLIRLYAAGRRVVVLIDEAHVMPEETLEQVRLLSNLESNRHKLLQIVLFGQPELDAALAKPSLRQLRDRITHAFRMRPLATQEVAKYVSFRMRAAGYRGPEVFSPRATRLLASASGGLTRRINILADKALLAAFTENTHAVGDRHVKAAIADSEFAELGPKRHPVFYAGAILVAGVCLGVGSHWLISSWVLREVSPAPQPVAERAPLPAASAAAALPMPAAAQTAEPPQRPANPPALAKPPDPAPEPAALLTPLQVERLSGYSSAGQKLLASRLSATRELLERAPDGHYAVELFITDNTDPARMERFLQRARELVPLQDLYIIPTPSGSRYRLRVVLGAFATHEAARQAEQRLPPKYQKAFRTAPRSFFELRAQI